MGLFLHDFHRQLVPWIVRLKSLTILDSLVNKPLVSVFAPLRSFFNMNFTRVKCSNFCTSKFFGYTIQVICASKFLVMKSSFCTSKFLVMKSSFLHFNVFVQKFILHHTDGPHHMMPPQKFMISAQHWYTVQKELHTERVLCSCQSWSQHQFLFERC